MAHNGGLVLSPFRAEQLSEIDLLIQSADKNARSIVTPEKRNGKDSPSSVLCVPPLSYKQKNKKPRGQPSLRSTVMVSDEGAELLLEDMDNMSLNSSSSSSYRTPNKSLRNCSTYSLLDDAESTYTPTPPPAKLTPKTPSSVDTDLCCTAYHFGCLQNGDDADSLQMIKLQGKLNNFLSDPLQLDALCNEWQVFGMSETTNVQKPPANISQTEIKQVLRNRAFNITERGKKIETIRRDISPFNATPVRNKRSPVKLGTVRSFDIAQHAPAIARGSTDNKDDHGFISIWQTGCLCNPAQAGESPAVIRSQVLDAVHEDTCYDSDPETFLRRPTRTQYSSSQLRSIRTSLSFSTSKSDDVSNKENMNEANLRQHHADYTDDNSIRQMVQEFMNERLTLILHTKGPTEKSYSPHAVKAWFERGQHLSCNSVIQPRFMWQSAHRKKQSRSSMAVSKSGIEAFDLIDVSRILPVDKVDRKVYPFAKGPNCFLVKTMDESLLFETKSKSERERLVRLFKLLVSRLGSQLLVGDRGFFDEYFITGSDGGPGDAPYWLSMHE